MSKSKIVSIFDRRLYMKWYFIKVPLKTFFGAMVMNSSKPSFQIHNVDMQIPKVFSIVRFYLLQIWKILFQGNIPFPLIGNDFCILTDVCFKERTQGGRRGVIYTSNTALNYFKSHYDKLFLSFVPTPSSSPPI